MWFDARKALAELVGGDMPPATSTPATTATIATRPRPWLPRVAVVASVAAPPAQKPKVSREADAGQLAGFLFHCGPSTYGAAASALAWGVTRTLQAEAHLLATGKVRLDTMGRAALVHDDTD